MTLHRKYAAKAILSFALSAGFAIPAHANSAETNYTDRIREQLAAFAHYPTAKEARLLRPRGQTVVWFTLDRNGKMTESGIASSSKSMILDAQALSQVRLLRYAQFGADCFPGEAQQRFRVAFNYGHPLSTQATRIASAAE
jgi:protein TonB